MTWRAHVDDSDALRRYLRINIGRVHAGGAVEVLNPGGATGSTVHAEGEIPSGQPALAIPEDAARALLDALAKHFGAHTHEARVQREDYLHERARVDRLIDVITRSEEAAT